MEQKQIYQCDEDGVWDRQLKFARPDPHVDGEWLIPGGCTDVAPPELSEHQAAVFAGGEWSVVVDKRGVVFWLPTGERAVITHIGVDLPPGALEADPGPTEAQRWAAYQALAQAELDFSDRVSIRCSKAGVAYPQDWRDRDAVLRGVMRAGSGDPDQPLPERPAFPSNT